MLGFAVVALFGLAVFSTIVATVNEMPKPNPAAYVYNYHKVPRDQKQSASDNSNMSTMFEVKVPTSGSSGGDYDDDRERERERDRDQDRWASPPVEYDDDAYEEETSPARPQRYQSKHWNSMPIGLPPAYAYPPYPGPGYVSGGVGQSSAGGGGGNGMRPSDTSNKAFVPFFGYIDPIILIAIVAFPVLCTLGVTSLLMPIIPIVIYIIGLIFPSSRKLMKAQNKVTPPTDNSTVKQKKNSLISESSLRALLWLVEKSIDRWQKRLKMKPRKRRKKM